MNATATISEFEKQLLHTFRGKYVNPNHVNSFNPKFFAGLYDKWDGLGASEQRQSPIKNLDYPVGRLTKEIDNMANLQIGKMVPNSKFKEIGSYDLEINIPFEPKMKFWVQPNKAQEGKTLSENAPSMVIFYHSNRVGAMWSKVSKTGDGFFSAQVFKKNEEGELLNFNLFPIKKKESDGSEIETGEYQANLFQKNERDEEENVDHSPK